LIGRYGYLPYEANFGVLIMPVGRISLSAEYLGKQFNWQLWIPALRSQFRCAYHASRADILIRRVFG